MLVLDAGTTGVKAFVFDERAQIVGKAYRRLSKFSPRPSWVEQSPQDMLSVCVQVLQEVLAKTGIDPHACRSFGITNQRETIIAWDKKSGKPIYPALVWEDRRTKARCATMRKQFGKEVLDRTGLPLDPYFSATKIRWVLENVQAATRLLQSDRLAVGTVDSWLLWNLCEDHPHVTDETNASRTLLFNIRTKTWDRSLLDLFGIPEAILPKILASRGAFGTLDPRFVGSRIPVRAVCGDQQSSLFSAMNVSKDMRATTKATYGTGSFVMQARTRFVSHPGFFTTLTPGFHRGSVYALEAKVEGSAAGVDRVLKDPKALRRYLRTLARKVDKVVQKLPRRPRTLVIDGGITRDGILREIQEEVSGIHVVQQEPYEGTARGIAFLLLGH